jgi:hypothetical protein
MSPIKFGLNPASAIKSTATGLRDFGKGYVGAFKAGLKTENILNTGRVLTGGRVYSPGLAATTAGGASKNILGTNKEAKGIARSTTKDVSGYLKQQGSMPSKQGAKKFVGQINNEIKTGGFTKKGISYNQADSALKKSAINEAQTIVKNKPVVRDNTFGSGIKSKVVNKTTVRDASNFLRTKTVQTKTGNVRSTRAGRATTDDVESFLNTPRQQRNMLSPSEEETMLKQTLARKKSAKSAFDKKLKLTIKKQPSIKNPKQSLVVKNKRINISKSTEDIRRPNLSAEAEGTANDIEGFLNTRTSSRTGNIGKGSGTNTNKGKWREITKDNPALQGQRTRINIQTGKREVWQGPSNKLDIGNSEVNISMGQITESNFGKVAVAEPEVEKIVTTTTKVSPAVTIKPNNPSVLPVIAPIVIPITTPNPYTEPEITPVVEPDIIPEPEKAPSKYPSKSPGVEIDVVPERPVLSDEETKILPVTGGEVRNSSRTVYTPVPEVIFPVKPNLGSWKGPSPRPPGAIPFGLDVNSDGSGSTLMDSPRLMGEVGDWQIKGLFVGIVDPATGKILKGGIQGKKRIKYGSIKRSQYRIAGGGNIASPGGRINKRISTM